MECKRCEALVPEGSVFCNKCGSRLDGIRKYDLSKNYTSIVDLSTNYKGTDYSNSDFDLKADFNKYSDFNFGYLNYRRRSNSFAKFIIILILMAVPVIAIIGFIIVKTQSIDHFDVMKRLYEEGKYQEITYYVDDYYNIEEKDEEYRRIAYTGMYGDEYQVYVEEMTEEYPDYERVLYNLFDGLENCKLGEKYPKDPIKKEVIVKFKAYYTNALTNDFGLTHEEIDEVLKLSYEARKEKFIEIAYKHIQKKHNKE